MHKPAREQPAASGEEAALSFTSANQLSPAEDYEAKLQQLRRKTLPQLREWVTLNRDYLSWEFMLWLADREEEADGHEQLELSVLCGQVMALREGLDPVSFEELQAEIQAAAAAEEAQAQQPDGDHSAAGPSALTVASRFDGIVRQSAQLALTQQGAVIAEQQMRLLDTDVKEARSQSTVELIGRKELSSGEAAQLPQSASAASRILDFLLTVGNRQERAHMLQDAFTPPEAAAGGREEEVELLHTTPLQLLQAIDLMLSREQQPHQLPAGADPAGQLQPSLLAAVGAMQQEHDLGLVGKEGFVGKVGTWVKWAYGLPGFATTSLSFLISVYATDFYVSVGASLSFLSFFTALARSCDVMTDPLMGWLSDRLRCRFGRRRPFMALGCVFYAALFTLLFSPPRGDGNSSNSLAAYWFGFFYTIFYLSDTFCNVPYEALGPELSDSYDERSKIFFLARMCNMFGMLVAAGAPASISYLLRTSNDKTSMVDCHALFDGPSGGPASNYPNNPHPPVFADTAVCRNSTECDGANANYCFVEAYQTGQPAHPDQDAKTYYYEAQLEVIDQVCKAVSSSLLSATSMLDCAGRAASPCSSAAVQAAGSGVGCIPFHRYSISALDAQRIAFTAVAAGFGAYYVIAMLHCVFVVRERFHEEGEHAPVPLVASIMRACKNLAFKPQLAAWALDGLALSALVTMFPFFIRYIVVSDGVKAQASGFSMDPQVCMGLSVMGLLLTAMATSPGWLYVANRFGKYYAWLLYNLLTAIFVVLFFIPTEGDPAATIAIMVVNGIPVGGQFLINSILADVIDYDEFLNGTRSEGAFSVFATLIPKFVAIPASALPLALINLMGFHPPISGVAQSQTNTVKVFIRFTFVLLPFVCSVLSFFIKMRFPIKTKEISNKISEGIAAHQRGEAALDPLTGREISLLKISAEEEKHVWLYENFSYRCLDKLMKTGNPDFIITEVFIYVAMGLVAVLSFGIGTGLTFRLMDNPTLAIIPIALVILTGASMCFFLLNLMRFLQARQLRRGDFRQHVALIQKVKDAKKFGQRSSTFEGASGGRMLVEYMPFYERIPVLRPLIDMIKHHGSKPGSRRESTVDPGELKLGIGSSKLATGSTAAGSEASQHEAIKAVSPRARTSTAWHTPTKGKHKGAPGTVELEVLPGSLPSFSGVPLTETAPNASHIAEEGGEEAYVGDPAETEAVRQPRRKGRKPHKISPEPPGDSSP
ncbi:hypothetical protein WJX72_005656 [[Myrmecia] bisecta]|uniref:Uncharacterized protein n=1 Tax=[Myrmecia] bisecta TaxID=41462 RepID=A0AAW1Q5D1_9CHLO